MSCSHCDVISLLTIRTPDDLNKAVANLQRVVRSGVLRYIGEGWGAGSFSELGHNCWNDNVSNFFTCKYCHQFFHLHAETYHGSGGALEIIEKIDEGILAN